MLPAIESVVAWRMQRRHAVCFQNVILVSLEVIPRDKNDIPAKKSIAQSPRNISGGANFCWSTPKEGDFSVSTSVSRDKKNSQLTFSNEEHPPRINSNHVSGIICIRWGSRWVEWDFASCIFFAAVEFPTNATELEAVFSVFDTRRNGRVHYKTFVDAIMRPDRQVGTRNTEIRDEELQNYLYKITY